MHWTVACACGQTLRLHEGQQGQWYCPACAGVVAFRPPRPARADQPRRWRRWWLVAAAVVLAAGIAGLAGARWSPADEPPPPPTLAMPIAGPMPSATRLQMRFVQPTAQQAPVEKDLPIPDSVSGELLPAGQIVPGLTSAGRVAPLIALAGDPQRGLLLTAGSDGLLHCYSPSLELLGSRRLPGIACQLALDGQGGLLYAVVAHPGALDVGPLGDLERTGSDIHVYDVKELLQGRSGPGGELVPVRSLSVGGQVHALLLSSDGQHLYYLIEARRDAQLWRIVTGSWSARQVQAYRKGGLLALAPVPGSNQIAGLAGGRLLLFDATTGTPQDLGGVTSAITAFAAGRDGQLFLLERRNTTFLVVIDAERRQVRERLAVPLVGRVYACTGPAARRLYVGSSAVLDGQVLAVDVPRRPGPLRAVARARRDPTRLIRGGLFLGPNGKLLLAGNGHAYHVPAAEDRETVPDRGTR